MQIFPRESCSCKVDHIRRRYPRPQVPPEITSLTRLRDLLARADGVFTHDRMTYNQTPSKSSLVFRLIERGIHMSELQRSSPPKKQCNLGLLSRRSRDGINQSAPSNVPRGLASSRLASRRRRRHNKRQQEPETCRFDRHWRITSLRSSECIVEPGSTGCSRPRSFAHFEKKSRLAPTPPALLDRASLCLWRLINQITSRKRAPHGVARRLLHDRSYRRDQAWSHAVPGTQLPSW